MAQAGEAARPVVGAAASFHRDERRRLREMVPQWRFYPVVETLQALRGIQFTSAIGLLAELGDLSRFDHPRQLTAWLGLTPSEHSSGQRRRLGSITKAGNGHARHLMVEAAWSYRHPAKVSPAIQQRHDGLPKAIIDSAWEHTVAAVRAVSQTGRPWQASQRRRDRDCTGAGRIRLGYRANDLKSARVANTRALITAPLQIQHSTEEEQSAEDGAARSVNNPRRYYETASRPDSRT